MGGQSALRKSLALIFPKLYAITQDQHITVQKVFANGLASLSFRGALFGIKLSGWNELNGKYERVTLNEDEDTLVWLLSTSNTFSVKSFYTAIQSAGPVPYKFLWKVNIPLRVKTFLLLILK